MKSSIRNNPLYPFLLVLVLSATFGFQAWRLLFNNFAVDVVGVNGLQMGIVQSLREVPGFLVFTVVFLLLLIKEQHLASIALFVFGLGIALVGLLPSFTGLIFSTLIMSTGFHYYETTHKSLCLQYFSKKEAPIVMASLRSYSALINIAVGVLFFYLSSVLPYWINYLLIGAIVILAAIVTFFMQPALKEKAAQRKKIVLKKKYWLFYVLNLLSGARRQIFVVFAVFLLVDKYEFSVQEIAILFMCNNIISVFVNPLIGRAINTYGERKVLTFEYVGLFFVFLGYATLDQSWLIALLYLLDHLFFNFSIGINTYLQKIADPEDIAPSTSIGFAINHIMAVIIPVLGGLMWLEDYRLPFELGIVLSIVSLYFVQQIRTPHSESTLSTNC